MKKIACMIAFLAFGYTYSQVEPKNVSEETTVKTTKINNGDKVFENKVKVTTREEQAIEFDEKDKNKRDKDIVPTPVKVTKIVEVANNNKNSKTELGYFEFNGNRYYSNKGGNDFFKANAEITSFKKENHYLFQNKNYVGIGYFDADGNFIVEYSDKMNGEVRTQEFKLVK
ncbi:hypothetical protein ACGK9U_10610 [Mariniflexile sp. HNIBRBA6329]|uniref:hypothetical protein n=1 Tax=Mariniflexile sp. HNIBRBA6329 TaxID=3373088 RepID=UPI003745153B